MPLVVSGCLPAHFVEVIHAIYAKREFFVHECGVDSDMRSQKSGISQGCPLSPYLFVILMTILLGDVREKLRDRLTASRSHRIV